MFINESQTPGANATKTFGSEYIKFYIMQNYFVNNH